MQLRCQLAEDKHTTLQSWAPVCDVQPQNRAGSLIGCDSRAQHAIGWSVEAEIVDAGGEKRLRVRVQVTVTEWTAGVGDDTTEFRVFAHEGTVVRSIIICGSTSGKDIQCYTFHSLIKMYLKSHCCCFTILYVLVWWWNPQNLVLFTGSYTHVKDINKFSFVVLKNF